ncbi:hypothetical protein VNO77_16522 [Canavalia gladiata]|uniref:Uncharacterized protein n=1 Tax=Canavalia gladiata TaxID=3824 RepID=A0AAN9QT54_CANGL
MVAPRSTLLEETVRGPSQYFGASWRFQHYFCFYLDKGGDCKKCLTEQFNGGSDSRKLQSTHLMIIFPIDTRPSRFQSL